MEENRERLQSEGEYSQEYANFILELLKVEESSSGFQGIYPILKQRQHLLNANFSETLQQVVQRLIAGKNTEAIESIVAIIENLSIHIYQFPRGSRANNIEIAITGYQIVLNNRQPGSENFAQTQNNLANAYSDRINGSRAENLERAIGFSDAALTVYTLDAFPINNVETLNNLGLPDLAKLDYINQEKPADTNQKTATLQSAYDTFKTAIIGASKLRKLESQNESKQKHDLQWDKLYKGMVQVCLDRASNQEALLYAEANKARNLAELIAQQQEIPKTLAPITFSEITQLLTPNTALIEWYITDAEIITFLVTYPDVLTVHRHRQHDELIDLVAEYRESYKTSKTNWQKQLATGLQRLADILQITTILPPSSTRLILIPHWLLHLFPPPRPTPNRRRILIR
ncbi:hypothetical protein IQ269_11650 [Tychonema sp. LEGE 07199]|uniref:hypothetical protein n=1 Tax=unclassified Tychonema TaxID=2642144 RepID=UPI00187E9599|nr:MULTISPECIES: hypothetical protein [unclassified Tychonema]MBE9121434.1 hypothetical protein [Tychonema sp. LEGE 07199]MBE9134652.1 hypothetical protein [Tychonema sp. LEGE 07196]